MRWAGVLSLVFFACSCGPTSSDHPDGRPDGGVGDGGSDAPVSVVETCDPSEIQPCTASAGTGGDGVILRGTIVTPDTLICSGDVLYSRASGTILCVGSDCSNASGASGAAIVCADVISPGLVNAHTHSNYGHLPPFQHPGEKFTDKSDWQDDADYDRFIDASSPSGGGIRDSMSCEIGKWDEAREMIGGGASLLGAAGSSVNQTCLVGVMRNLDVTNANELDRQHVNYEVLLFSANGDDLAADMAAGIGASLHVAEGVTLAWRSSEWDTVMSHTLLVDRVNIVHGTALGVGEMGELRTRIGSITWSPRSNADLYGLTSPIPAMKNMGLSIALGTDWTPSGSQDPLEELKCADWVSATYYDHLFTDHELVAMVTINAARGVLLDDRIGRLAEGLEADITAFRGDRQRPYRAIIDAELDDVIMVVVGGESRYGDADLMTALAENPYCEDLDVCGRPRRICVKTMAGPDATYRRDQTLPQIKSALEAALAASGASCTGSCYQYGLEPLFVCDRPPPSDVCRLGTDSIPGLPGAGDMDGDGIGDGTDKCASVFDPPLVGETAEADFDGDGLGDACDPCPASTDTVCPAPDAGDVDGDGVPNADDNCPSLANGDQTDGDLDDVGDACDGCMGDPNPACFTLGVLRDPTATGHPPAGTHVEFGGVVVTAVKNSTTKGRHLFVQDPEASQLGGIAVYFGSTALPGGVAVGSVVTVSGTYKEFNGLSEITSPSVTITGSTTPLTPIDIAPAMIATGGARAEALESMLVRVSNVSVTNPNPDAPSDFDEFEVTGGLRVDDLIIDGCDPSSTTAPCTGTKTWGTFSGTYTITGVLSYSFGDSKLLPRDKTNDFDPDAP